MEIKKCKETIKVIYNGVGVFVKIDYMNEKISLREPNGNAGVFKDKQWVFAGRGLEYIKGWNEILDAMKVAIAEGERRLKEYDEIINREILEVIGDFSSLDKPKKKK